ncbi:MAG: DUF2914 domain-containing protein [Patescibacteria group bacterium]
MLQRAKTLFERHGRKLSALAFVFGFLWDSLTLTRIDRLLDNIVLLSYLLIAFVCIALLNADSARNFANPLLRKSVDFARFLLPFAFGGLMSGFLIFYSRSGPVLSSAPFLLFLAGLFLCNEFLRRRYQQFIFRMSVFFVTLFSYTALVVPVLTGRMGDLIFLASGATALVLFWLSIKVLSLVAEGEWRRRRPALWTVVGSIFVAFNFLYFNNMIPPIPLSLKEIGVYHRVERARSGSYELSFEKAPWYALGRKTNLTFHRTENEPVYVFSSVFAPTRLSTEVLHRWSYFNEKLDKWVSSSVVGFPISGGRDEGYRGYSRKDVIFPGKWRVDVETIRGQIVGRITFVVTDSPAPPALAEEKR